jgi:uncharacterized SAM-binding protein YcdF (DUF218 family)
MKRRVGYTILLPLGLLMALGVLWIRGFFSAPYVSDRISSLCDAFFVPGVLLTGFGMLIFVAGGGLFDMLAYGAQRVYWLVFKAEKSQERPATFYDYRLRKAASGKPRCSALLVSGAFFLCLSVLFLLLME